MKMHKFIFGLLSLMLIESTCFAGRHLDYRECGIVDDSIARDFRSHPPKSVSALAEELMLQQDPPVESVNLSGNHIRDEGAETLRVKLWQSGAFPRLRELDLSFNRVGSKGLSSFESVLDREEFQYLIIVGNPVATLGSKAYFTQVSQHHLLKLIWCPESWIDSRKWEILLSDRSDSSEIAELIARIHKEYYREKREQLFGGEKISVEHTDPKDDFLPYVLSAEQDIMSQHYNNALKNKDSEAANILGVRYWRGHGVKKDVKKALAWFEYAIELGSIRALYNRGKIFLDEGRREEGMKLIEEAAKKFHFDARRMLGWLDEGQSKMIDVH